MAARERVEAMTTATKAVRCYSVQRGDFWRGQCLECSWTSRELPFKTREEAEHCADLHAALCKKAPQETPAPPPESSDEDRRRAGLLAEGMSSQLGPLAPDAVDWLAQGIAVARSGGDVEAFLRGQLRGKRP